MSAPHAVLAAPLLPLPPVQHHRGHLVVVSQGAPRHVHQVTVLSVNLGGIKYLQKFVASAIIKMIKWSCILYTSNAPHLECDCVAGVDDAALHPVGGETELLQPWVIQQLARADVNRTLPVEEEDEHVSSVSFVFTYNR